METVPHAILISVEAHVLYRIPLYYLVQLQPNVVAAIQKPKTIPHSDYGISSSFMTIAYRAPIDRSNNLEHTAKTLA